MCNEIISKGIETKHFEWTHEYKGRICLVRKTLLVRRLEDLACGIRLFQIGPEFFAWPNPATLIGLDFRLKLFAFPHSFQLYSLSYLDNINEQTTKMSRVGTRFVPHVRLINKQNGNETETPGTAKSINHPYHLFSSRATRFDLGVSRRKHSSIHKERIIGFYSATVSSPRHDMPIVQAHSWTWFPTNCRSELAQYYS